MLITIANTRYAILPYRGNRSIIRKATKEINKLKGIIAG